MLERVVPSERFENDVKKLKPDYPQIDAVVRGINWGLVHDPYAGEPIADSENRVIENRYVYLTSPVEYVTPIFRVIYKFSETHPQTIVLISIGL